MSTESPRNNRRSNGAVVRPSSVSEKSVIENVVGFFHDVVPQSYSAQAKPDDKEVALWLKLERGDLSAGADGVLDSSRFDVTKAPLVLIVGYSSGVQIWCLPVSGEAQEVYSTRQGPVKVFTLLPNPEGATSDVYHSARPLAAVSDDGSNLRLVSLRTGEGILWNKTFQTPVGDVLANSRVVIVSLHRKVAAFDAATLEQKFVITSCYPTSGHKLNPLALGSSWLAYAEKQLVPVYESNGGLSLPDNPSYTATAISAAKNVKKGIASLSERVVSSMTTGWAEKNVDSADSHNNHGREGTRPGIVTIVDFSRVKDMVDLRPEADCDGVVAHFTASHREVALLKFDPSGTLLFVACKRGTTFNVFRILPHSASSSLAAAHHIYALRRGDTPAKVLDAAFTQDSRWLAVCTARGTTHVFAVAPYGGAPCARTHVGAHIVNKLSRFQKSAGLDELSPSASTQQQTSPHAIGGGCSAITASPSQASSVCTAARGEAVGSSYHHRLSGSCENPRLVPFPLPDSLDPYVQIKQSVAAATLATLSAAAAAAGSSSASSPKAVPDECGVAACFASSRGWLPESRDKALRGGDHHERTLSSAIIDSLFVVGSDCLLGEYVLEPRAAVATVSASTTSLSSAIGESRVTDDTQLELAATARAQWILQRSASAALAKEVRSLPPSCPLLQAREQLVSDAAAADELVSRYGSKESLSSDSSVKSNDMEEAWLSQVEIVTYAGPHRRLWMGPQFKFKTYQGSAAVLSASSSALLPGSNGDSLGTADVVCEPVDLHSLAIGHPSLPITVSGHKRLTTTSSDHTFIEAGSYEPSPHSLDQKCSWDTDELPVSGDEDQHLKETLADAMQENDKGLMCGGTNCVNGAVCGGEDLLVFSLS